jgi:hypothetical protein
MAANVRLQRLEQPDPNSVGLTCAYPEVPMVATMATLDTGEPVVLQLCFDWTQPDPVSAFISALEAAGYTLVD